MNQNQNQILTVGAVYNEGKNVFSVVGVDTDRAVVANLYNGRVYSMVLPVIFGRVFADTKAISDEIGHKENKTLRVVRHVRPSDIFSKELYGMTLVFDLDYTTRKINVGISVCNGDQFSRKTGLAIALSGKNYITGLDMPDSIFNGETNRGLVSWFIEDSIDENMDNPDAVYNISQKTVELMIDMYFSSKNFFNNLDLE